MANTNVKITSGTANLKATLSNTVISGGTNDYNQLENLPDLSVYATTRVSRLNGSSYEHRDYTQDEYAIIIGDIEDIAYTAVEATAILFDVTGQINSDLENKADKDHTHEEYLTEHQDISGKADVGHIHDYNELENLPDLGNYEVKKSINYRDGNHIEISEYANEVIHLNINQDTIIVLPDSLGFYDAKEITLILNVLEDAIVTFENVGLWQNEPVIEAGTVCELIFTWSGGQWLGGCIVYHITL